MVVSQKRWQPMFIHNEALPINLKNKLIEK